ncbi:hypothetical protein [Massilia phyllosphaerae]|uniref:hypothetical protein n=1 Tax=Massilia phyllosphaerae TaxID=3106034 RepID=UPI002B1CADE8|nr:hypothetical protein [Massilia sp. SGZ-792]
MKKQALFVPLFALAVLAGCGKPVPKEKLAYVGEWQEPNMYLLITEDGSVTYKRIKNGSTTSIDGPLKGFEGDNFDVGVGPMATTFVVNKPPYQVGDQWKMVVDGQELIKTPDAG